MQLITHLHFNGNCETAFKFYEQTLGGKIVTMMPHEGTPAADHVPPEWRKKIPACQPDCRRPVVDGSRRSARALSAAARFLGGDPD